MHPSHNLVMHLLNKYIHKGYHLFTDRYYTSLPLAQTLQDTNTLFTGTSQRERVDIPDDIRAGVTLADGEVKAFRCERLMCLAWRNKTKKVPVIMVSTACSAQITSVTSRNGRSEDKPLVVHTYNTNMNGVDVMDQYTVSYPFVRKTLKWWRKVFFWLLDVSVTNSYALYCDTVSRPMAHIRFRRSIVESYAAQYLSSIPPRQVSRPRKRPHSESGDPERLNSRLHLLGKRGPRECVVCSNPTGGEKRDQYITVKLALVCQHCAPPVALRYITQRTTTGCRSQSQT